MPGLMRGVARTAVVAGTASAVAGRVHRRQDAKWAEQDAAAAYAQAPPPPPAAAGTDDKLDQLKQLGELKAAGVLTEIEFEVQKSKILSG
jgi:hypothetical protein